MFLAVYETRRVQFEDGVLFVERTPTGYRVTGKNDDHRPAGFGDTPMAAIADYNAAVQE